MAAGDPILDVSDLINLCTGGGGGAPEQINFYKSGLQNGAALGGTPIIGRISSMWRWDGTPGAATQTAPTTAVVCTNTLAGSLQQTTSATNTKKRLLSVTAAALVPGTLILYDRLVQHGGMSGTTTTAQTTNFVGGGPSTPALTRRTSGIGVEIWLEIYTIIGTTGTTVTCAYTDTTPAASTTQAITFGGTNAREQDRILPVALASGDIGVTTVTNVDLVASTLTAGNFGVTLAYPLVSLALPMPGVGSTFSSFILPGGPLDLGATSDACLAFAWFPNTTTAPQVYGSAFFMEK